MGQSWHFTVYGLPRAQGRPRAFLMGRQIRMRDPEESVIWKNLVRLSSLPYKPSCPSVAPLAMRLTFWLPRPSSLPKKIQYHIKKPDLDNLEKSIKDALEGIFYRNDSQICELHTAKYYGAQPSVEIELTEL